MSGQSRGPDRDEDIRREIENHLALEAEALDGADAPSAEARRRARLAFGNPAVVHEDVRAVWTWVWLEQFVYDVRYALRMWMGSPALAAVAILTIAIGIGASTAIAGQIKEVFWTTLAVSDPQALRQLTWSSPRFPYVMGGALNVLPGPSGSGSTFGSFSYTAYEALARDSAAVANLACWADFGEARPVALGSLGFGTVQFVSGNYFDVLGVGASLGRTLHVDDDGPETWAPVALIGHGFWQRAFGGDTAVTTRSLTLNGRVFAIVGVLPETFSGLDPATPVDIVIPVGAASIAAQTTNPLRNAGIWSICRVVARLRPGVSDERARSEFERVLAGSIATTPPAEPYDPPRVQLEAGGRGLSTLREASSAPLGVLLAGIGTLLAAACANIAGLLLARGRSRQREIATRLALGAPRRRVIRQLLTESLLLSAAGGAIGIGVAFALSGSARDLLSQFMPTVFGADRAIALSTAPDLRVLGVALVTTIACGLLFGAAPALGATRVDLISAIRQVQPPASGRHAWSTGRVLVAAQSGLAVLLLVSCGLFVRTLANLESADLGFPVEHLLYARVEPRSANLPQSQRSQFFEQALARLERLPGVRSVAAATSVPFGGKTNVGAEPTLTVCWTNASSGLPVALPVQVNLVSPGYFSTLDVPMLSGRDFAWSDRPSPQQIPVIVSEGLARRTFGVAGAVGGSLRVSPDCAKPEAGSAISIVGVSSDVRSDGRAEPPDLLYWPLRVAGAPTTLLVRTAGDPGSMIATVRAAVREVHPDIPTFSEAPLTAIRERAFRRERLISTLLGLFATVTALVGALGIYGMLTHDVSRRRAEIGIRMAIGADAPAVVRLVLGHALVAVSAGLATGLAAAVVVTRLFGSLLFGVSPGDPLVLAGAAGLFLIVAIAAVVVPAREATRIDPVLSLRL